MITIVLQRNSQLHEGLMKAAIVDLGLGNIGSLQSALKFCGYESELICEPKSIKSDLWILPGVGSYAAAMKMIMRLDMKSFLQDTSQANIFIGICLGMQLLGNSSSEGGQISRGLGLIDFEVISLKEEGWGENRLPNLGFRTTFLKDKEVFHEYDSTYPFYYVHSFVASQQTVDKSYICASFKVNNKSFVSGVRKDRIIGLQFHPEKSHLNGLKVIKNLQKL